MKLLRTIRFDASDTRVFDPAAEPEEWSVSGASLFGDIAADDLTGKLKQAFANGFLGTASLGHATFVVVASATERDVADIVERFTGLLIERLGAPSLQEAKRVAEAEVSFAADLCRDLAQGSVIAVSRTFAEDGSIAEKFHVVRQPQDPSHDVRLWSSVDDA